MIKMTHCNGRWTTKIPVEVVSERMRKHGRDPVLRGLPQETLAMAACAHIVRELFGYGPKASAECRMVYDPNDCMVRFSFDKRDTLSAEEIAARRRRNRKKWASHRPVRSRYAVR